MAVENWGDGKMIMQKDFHTWDSEALDSVSGITVSQNWAVHFDKTNKQAEKQQEQ